MKKRKNGHTSNVLIKTSFSDPLRIDRIIIPKMGYIGMTICPGKHYPSIYGHRWERDLGQDIGAIIKQGGKGLLTLMTKGELERMKISNLGNEVKKKGLRWWHLPVDDMETIESDRFHEWDRLRIELIDFIVKGNNLVIHCRGGLGRTGTFAAVLLMDILDISPDNAISEVRSVRRGAIQTDMQRNFIYNYRNHFPLLILPIKNK